MFKFLLGEKEFEKPPYIHEVEVLLYVRIIRLQGALDQSMIPVIEERVQEDRRRGGKINHNMLLDFAKVERIDTATIAYHLVEVQEYQEAHHRIGFINLHPEQHALLGIFNVESKFIVYPSETDAVNDLNRPA